MPLSTRPFPSVFRNAAAVDPFFQSLHQKRHEAEYHIGRLSDLSEDFSSLFPGAQSLTGEQILVVANAEMNSSMHVLRCMLDIVAQIVNAELQLGQNRLYFSNLSGITLPARVDAERRALEHATIYLRDFDNYTKHQNTVETSMHFEASAHGVSETWPVSAFAQGGRSHPAMPNAAVVAEDTFNAVIEGICALLQEVHDSIVSP